jgi:hypothetical protein
MSNFVPGDNTTILSICFDEFERLIVRGNIMKYILGELGEGELEDWEFKRLYFLEKKFRNKLFHGFIWKKDKSTVIGLTPDEIRKLIVITSYAQEDLEKKDDELKQKLEMKIIVPLEEAMLLTQSVDNKDEQLKCCEIASKIAKIMLKNIVYFNTKEQKKHLIENIEKAIEESNPN